MKKYRILVWYFNPKTREVDTKATLITKPVSKERAIEIAKEETLRWKNACWEIK